MKNDLKESEKTAKKRKNFKITQNIDVTPLATRNGEVKQQGTPWLTPEMKLDENETGVSRQKNAFQFMMSSRHKNNEQGSLCAEICLNGDTVFEAGKKTRTKKGHLKSPVKVKDTSKRKRECDDIEQLEESYDVMEISDVRKSCSDDVILTKKKRVSRVLVSDEEVEEIETHSRKNERKWKLKIKFKNVENLVENVISKTNLEEPVVANGGKYESDVDNGSEGNNGTDEKEEIAESSSPELIKAVEKVCIRRSLRSRKSVIATSCTSSDDMEDYIVGKKTKTKKKKHSKLAPVFLNSLPKPKIDPKVIEARRLFLLSGVPTVLRKELVKQQSLDPDLEVTCFPSLSHIQQKSNDNVFWTLEKPQLQLSKETEFEISIPSFDFSTDLSTSERTVKDKFIRLCDVNEIKNIIKKVKAEHPEYPVFKIFNSICNRSVNKKRDINTETQTQLSTLPKRRGRKKKICLSTVEPVILDRENESEENTHSMWTEKYRAHTSTDMVGNSKAILSLKTWLSNWCPAPKDGKITKCFSNSESEFETTDGDSRDSAKLRSNTIVLKGPRSSGKSSAVYAVCTELGLSVLEVNASSKRTGKLLLQQLQEATQSHQLIKKENVFVEKKKKESSKRKMCVLLIEDLDLIFEQDEGFTGALQQIVTTSKRPIILTTTEDPSNSIQKIMDNYKVIYFGTLNSVLTIWLQIVCLVEGCYFRPETLQHLITFYEGDIRRTLLQLQFWFNSDRHSHGILDNDFKYSPIQNLPMYESSLENLASVNYPIEIVWWNLSKLIDLPNLSNMRLNAVEKSYSTIGSENTEENKSLKQLFDIFSSFSTVDVICAKHNRPSKNLDRRWRTKATESLLLEEQKYNYQNLTFERDLTDFLMCSSVRLYLHEGNQESDSLNINLAVPSLDEQKWQSKQSRFEENLEAALLDLDYLERKATSLDYMSTLRAIARSENERARLGSKRRTRFSHYLKELDVKGGEPTYTWACNIFREFD